MKRIGYAWCGMIHIAFFYALQLVVFALMRIAFFIQYANIQMLNEHLSNLPLLFFNAFRFDAQVVAYFTIPLIILLLPFFAAGERYSRFMAKFIKIYSVIVVAIVVLLSLMDMQFYSNFNSHFNIVLFDFFDENPVLLIKGIWEEHPIIIMSILLTVFVFLSWKVVNRIFVERSIDVSKTKFWTMLTSFILLFGLAIRGSITTFPLRAEDIYVSSCGQLNDCVPNSVFMLKKAMSERKNQIPTESEETILKNYGFASLREAIATYFQTSADSVEPCSIDDWVFAKTGKSLLKQPNVVLIIVESWSNQLAQMDDSLTFDMLGSMRQHLASDIYFPHFQSATNGTIDAVEALTVSSPYRHLFTSKYRYQQYPSDIALPFANNGYDTQFITGIEISWRNLYEVLPNQGFNRVVGKYEILDKNPDVECNKTWGVYDHDMLNYLFEQLQRSDKPQFIVSLTSTSHTPFEFPKDYYLPELNLKDKLSNFAINEDIATDYIKGFQYESRALGDFIQKIKSSDLADNTIVAITGDHNIRMLFPYTDDKSLPLKHSVPLYVYMPELLRNTIVVDTSKYGCHYDIMPTLAPLSLDSAKYFALGQNLFSTDSTATVSINMNQVLHSHNIDDAKAQRIADARDAICKIYFQRWFLNQKH